MLSNVVNESNELKDNRVKFPDAPKAPGG